MDFAPSSRGRANELEGLLRAQYTSLVRRCISFGLAATLGLLGCTSHEDKQPAASGASGEHETRGVEIAEAADQAYEPRLRPRKKPGELPLPDRAYEVEAPACAEVDCALLARETFTNAYRINDDKGEARAFRLSYELCESGNARACLDLERMLGRIITLHEGRQGPEWSRAYLRAACDGDIARACEELAEHRHVRRHKDRRDTYLRKAAELYAVDCKNKNQEACIRRIGLPWANWNPPRDDTRHDNYWQLCDAGHSLACERAALITLTDETDLDPAKHLRALKALNLACESRSSQRACSLLAELLLEGDEPAAAKRVRRALALGCHASALEQDRRACGELEKKCEAGDLAMCDAEADRGMVWLGAGE